MLLLQFRAARRDDVAEESCAVDCWVIPRENIGGATYRYALDRLLAQGLRRCQGMQGFDVEIGGYRPVYREYFSGLPVFEIEGRYRTDLSRYGYSRSLDVSYGAFYWKYGDNDLLNDNDERVWDTVSLWRPDVTA